MSAYESVLYSGRERAGGRIQAWHRIAGHPFFEECYRSEDSLIDAMMAKLDEVHKYLTALEQYDDHPVEHDFWDDRT